jgi:methyl-accepting chemotaxis protein
MVQQNAALVEQSAAAAENMSAQAEELVAAVSRFAIDGTAQHAAPAAPAPAARPVRRSAPGQRRGELEGALMPGRAAA